ncbi:phosphopantetheine-binding protein [Caldovatus aquaticus]|uniref:Carrier domain-containing protein n=1 Tax=Caldovatus aquaticus TaxID=2865671 RepID=A0ABS7F1K3_9PROT|nr:phosphopantetheine-binding protein [Caldovatus aquaticus]MBW8268686.1 hypothetical protein [Caldovatus aquaticus]
MTAVQPDAQTTERTDDTILRLLTEALARKLGEAGIPAAGIGEETDLLDLGVIDSQGLLDVILEVEESGGRTFDPLRIDFETGITLGKLAGAFA